MSNKTISVTPVILCGGSGARLWPLSRVDYPKQFLKISGNDSLFRQAVIRGMGLPNKNIHIHPPIIVTNESHRFLCVEELKGLSSEASIILEPEGKNTAPALTLASFLTNEKDSDSIMVVLPADHLILDLKSFNIAMNTAIQLAVQDTIVVIGVPPSSPNINFGYIKSEKNNFKKNIFSVKEFVEKPSALLAKQYYNSGEYFWNAGMFVLKSTVWLKAIDFFSKDIKEITEKSWVQRTTDLSFIRPNSNIFKQIPNDSIDYAVIEKCPGSNFVIHGVELQAGWSDLGSWRAVSEIRDHDKDGNQTNGDIILHNTKNTFIESTHRLVATNGVDNLIIIETPDAVLVSHKKSQDEIKVLTQKLAKFNRLENRSHRKVFRPWGWFDILEEGVGFKVKRIYVKPQASLSLQSHKKRAEHWVVIKGEATVTLGDKKITLLPNQSTYISPNTKHRLANETQLDLEIIEVQSGEYLGEDDIERFDDNYGRLSID